MTTKLQDVSAIQHWGNSPKPQRSRTREDDREDDIELAALRVLTAYELLGGVRMTLSGARALVREMIEDQT